MKHECGGGDDDDGDDGQLPFSSSPLINSHGQEQKISARASGAMAPKIMRHEGNVQKQNRGKQKSKKKQRISSKVYM